MASERVPFERKPRNRKIWDAVIPLPECINALSHKRLSYGFLLAAHSAQPSHSAAHNQRHSQCLHRGAEQSEAI